jgi:hypothetical protein
MCEWCTLIAMSGWRPEEVRGQGACYQIEDVGCTEPRLPADLRRVAQNSRSAIVLLKTRFQLRVIKQHPQESSYFSNRHAASWQGD